MGGGWCNYEWPIAGGERVSKGMKMKLGEESYIQRIRGLLSCIYLMGNSGFK